MAAASSMVDYFLARYPKHKVQLVHKVFDPTKLEYTPVQYVVAYVLALNPGPAKNYLAVLAETNKELKFDYNQTASEVSRLYKLKDPNPLYGLFITYFKYEAHVSHWMKYPNPSSDLVVKLRLLTKTVLKAQFQVLYDKVFNRYKLLNPHDCSIVEPIFKTCT